MKRPELNRRDFTKLTMAAFGGVLAGTTVGCGSGDKDSGGAAASTPETPGPADSGEQVADAGPWMGDIHVCKGLNACKGKGAGDDNACAGQGSCSTVAEHSCSGENDCKYQGGCMGTAGLNDCKTQGGCHVPLSENAWKGAREAFEKALTAAGKEYGSPPGA